MMEMESLLPETTYGGGIKNYLRRRRYQRLDGGGRKKMKTIRLGSTRKYWRIKAIPRLRWVMRPSLKILTKLKNAYVNFMLRFSGNVGAINTDNIFGEKRIPKARQVSKGHSNGSFETRLIVEFSKIMVGSYQRYPM